MKKEFDPITNDIYVQYSTSLYVHDSYHAHNACEIYLLINGEVDFYIEESCYRLSSGDLFIVYPGDYHRLKIINQKEYERVVVNVSNTYFDTLSTSITDLSVFLKRSSIQKASLAKLNTSEQNEFLLIINKIRIYVGNQKYGSDLLLLSHLLQMLVKINLLFMERRIIEFPDIMHPLVSKTIHYIDSHLLESISLQDLSNYLFHNGIYISRKFKSVTGLSIQQYILRKRIGLAQKNLKAGCSVTESCMLAGFNNYSNFSRTFSKFAGCSPKQYQKEFSSHTC